MSAAAKNIICCSAVFHVRSCLLASRTFLYVLFCRWRCWWRHIAFIWKKGKRRGLVKRVWYFDIRETRWFLSGRSVVCFGGRRLDCDDGGLIWCGVFSTASWVGYCLLCFRNVVIRCIRDNSSLPVPISSKLSILFYPIFSEQRVGSWFCPV